jgi:alpha-1,3-rhamnosyl/mannosyltransferase
LLHLATRILTFGRYGNTELDYHRWSARYTAHHAAHIITISHFTKQDIITRYHVDAARISVIYLGFDPAAFLHPSDSVMQNTLRQHGITQPYLLSVGRLERKKNIAQLIRVFANIHTQYPQLRLVLVGSPGTGWDEAEDCINQYDLKTHISILGWQPRSVSTALLAGACAFVFLSRFEGFGMPLIEAFAVGTPVIASRTSAIPEIAGDAALLVNPEDLDATTSAILTVVRHPNVQQQLVQRGKNRCALFSWSTAAMETEKVLRSVAQDESSAGVVKKA